MDFLDKTKIENNIRTMVRYAYNRSNFLHQVAVRGELRDYISTLCPGPHVTRPVLRSGRIDLLEFLIDTHGADAFENFYGNTSKSSLWDFFLVVDSISSETTDPNAFTAEAIAIILPVWSGDFEDKAFKLLGAKGSCSGEILDEILRQLPLTEDVARKFLSEGKGLDVMIWNTSRAEKFLELLRLLPTDDPQMATLASDAINRGELQIPIALQLIGCDLLKFDLGKNIRPGNNSSKLAPFLESSHGIIEMISHFQDPLEALSMSNRDAAARLNPAYRQKLERKKKIAT